MPTVHRLPPSGSSLLLLLCLSTALSGQSTKPVSTASTIEDEPAIVRPTSPRDSRGETVYEIQTVEQQDQPVIAGHLSRPRLIKQVNPKFPRSSRKRAHQSLVTLSGVVAANGDFIDLQPEGPNDPDELGSAIKAASQWRFAPAALDGKPVALQIRLEVNFEVH